MKLRLGEMEPKRATALVAAPGLIALAADAGLAHFAGRDMAHPGQLVPVILGPVLGVALGAAALHPGPNGTFAKALRWVGGVAVLLGGLGTAFHLRALMRLLEGDAFTLDGLMNAIAVAPPAMAPAAFAGLGALLLALASKRVEIRVANGAT
jgi:hypothetical protein